ncbi:MAG: Esterase [Actinomycetia bacterium]|nr:Esterase [Actinomycetes bacterium]
MVTKRIHGRIPGRGVALLACVGLLVFGGAGRAFANGATDRGYPYPSAPDCDEQTGTNCVGDQWGFTQGQCHSWVAYRLNQLNAKQLRGGRFDANYRQPAGQRWGGAGGWANDAARAGITVDDHPALGSVAWWSADGGHVAYVEAVNADGTVGISEMNRDFHNGFDLATLRRGVRWPAGFIHIADRPATKPPGTARAGYWMLGADGHVYGFGGAAHFGNAGGGAVAMATRRDGRGYWVTDARGTVSHFGAAIDHGGRPSLGAGEGVSAMSATPSGNGYWLFTNLGRAFAYGDAHFFGDMRATRLQGAVIASAATATGRGYYMVGSDGGVFTFGDARFRGSTGAMRLVRPVVGIAPTPDNRGYWLTASDGGVFAFGAPFRGSMGAVRLAQPVGGLVAFGTGYLMVAADGGVFNFSNKPFFGSLGGTSVPSPIIGITAFNN